MHLLAAIRSSCDDVASCDKMGLKGVTKQASLERQDLSCTKLAHHERESIKMTVICNVPGISCWLANKASCTSTSLLVLQLAVCLHMLGNGASTFAHARYYGKAVTGRLCVAELLRWIQQQIAASKLAAWGADINSPVLP